MIFSDGDAIFPVNEFTNMNMKSGIRVFSFQIGQRLDSNELKTLANQNRGKHIH